jgi:beta-ureidopropionase / N-carbamoyl-L-amino-acid hydrolase
MVDLRVSPDRMEADFEELSRFGATPEGGVDRPALGEAHLAARAWLRQRIQADGLELRLDQAGNHLAFLGCGPQGAPALLLGSHLDSVPDGGRFDGALGVLAALEVLRSVRDAGLSLPVNLEAIDFTDEEGTLVGLLGSYALAGHLKAEDLLSPRGGRDRLLLGLERAGLSEGGLLEARRGPSSLAGYLELHIEQGPRLLQAGVQIGVVTGIVGICSYRLAFTGRADHAGTTPMRDRLDAAQGAAAFTLAVRQKLLQDFPECVANVGMLRLLPGAFNIVPARAELALELRSAEPESYAQLEAALLVMAKSEAARYGLGLEIEFLGRHQPTPLSPLAQQAIRQAAGSLGLSHMPLASGAGHDAQSLAPLCPSGMLFVPSQSGASHSPREFTTWEDCLNGANVLLQAALFMARAAK